MLGSSRDMKANARIIQSTQILIVFLRGEFLKRKKDTMIQYLSSLMQKNYFTCKIDYFNEWTICWRKLIKW